MANPDYKLVLTYKNKKGKAIQKVYPAVLDDKLIDRFLALDLNGYDRGYTFGGWNKEMLIDHITSYGIAEQDGLILEAVPTDEVDSYEAFPIF